MTTRLPPQCTACVRLLSIADEELPAFCTAYPDGIPPAIWEGRADHRSPYRGDQGNRFEQDPAVLEYPFELFRIGVVDDET